MSTCINEGPTFRCECKNGNNGPWTYCNDINECQPDQCKDQQYGDKNVDSIAVYVDVNIEKRNQMYYNINECLLGLNKCRLRQNYFNTDDSLCKS